MIDYHNNRLCEAEKAKTRPLHAVTQFKPIARTCVENEERTLLEVTIYTGVTQTLVLPVATCIMNIEKDGVGIGKYYEKGGLDVGGDIHCSGWLNVANGIKLQYDNKYIEQTKAMSWTPYMGLTDGTIFGSFTAIGEYAVLGDYIWFQCRVVAGVPSYISSCTGNVRIYGLPYVGKYNYPACNVGWCSGFNSATSWNGYGAYVELAQSCINLTFMYMHNNVGVWQELRSIHLAANRYIDLNVSGIYKWR